MKFVNNLTKLTTSDERSTGSSHVFRPDAYDLWLDPGTHHLGKVCELLKPYEAALMRGYPVSSRVNHVVNDDEECSRPLEIAENQNRLFV